MGRIQVDASKRIVILITRFFQDLLVNVTKPQNCAGLFDDV